MRLRSAWMAGMLAVAAAHAQPPAQPVPSTPLFTTEERSAILEYWGADGRYSVGVPADSGKKGLWHVRLTVAGSTWLLNYNRKRGLAAPPTSFPKPANEQQVGWEKWVVAKLARDRWDAWQLARAQNQRVLSLDMPASDKTIPAKEPPATEPMPTDLSDLVGDAPRFAEAVVPMEHTIAFDDITLKYRDNVKVSSPRYPYYRFERGVNSEGISMSKMPADQIARVFSTCGMSEREIHVMRAVSELEGGFDSVNTYDTGFVSVGFIQFACLKEGANSLGGMMRQYKQGAPVHFADDFHKYGIDVTDAGTLDVIDPVTGTELSGPLAAMKMIDEPRLVAVFQRAGLKSDAFVAAQIRAAKTIYWPENDVISLKLSNGSTLTGKISDFIKSEAGMATVFDRKVNTGRYDLLLSTLESLVGQVHPTSMTDFAPYEKLIVQRTRYRRDFLVDASLSQPEDSPSSPTAKTRKENGRRERGG